jgi:hypothetical protein
MEVLDLNLLLTFKNNEAASELDTATLNLLNELFGFDRNRRKKVNKNGVNILKNHKIQSKKDTIVNRVNLILNKLSESNLILLVIEFIENINQVTEEEYNEIQKTVYLKVLSEINFVKIYLQFIQTIGYLYNKVMNYDLSYLYSIIEAKFKLDYGIVNLDYYNESYSFLNIIEGEMKRINNMILIKNLVDNKFMSDQLLSDCDKVIINQTKFLPDIYYWFNFRNRDLNKDEIDIINNHLNNNIPVRDKVLLENLVNKLNKTTTNKPSFVSTVIVSKLANPVESTNKVSMSDKKVNSTSMQTFNVFKKPVEIQHINKVDTIKLECDNIIEEYMLIKSIDDMKYFIEQRCTDALTKNKFCEQLIDKYFSMNKNYNDIIELIKILIKSQALFKSNLSRGLLLVHNNWKDRSIDYIKPNERMKLILNTLKSIGITKGIETLIDNYNIDGNTN